jgi:hypothetical protein
MIAGQPIGGFEVVAQVTEKIAMLIHYCKGHDIACQHQDITNRHKGMLLEKRPVLWEFQVEVGAVLKFNGHFKSFCGFLVAFLWLRNECKHLIIN